MPLTDTAIRQSKPFEKPRKLPDGQGLYLLISPTGGKLWRFDFKFAGKRKTLSLGKYPTITLAEARKRVADAKALLASNQDPTAAKRSEKLRLLQAAEDSFEAIARDWFARHLKHKAESHRSKVERRLERDVFPYIGQTPVVDLTSPEILALARKVESRGTIDTAHRVIQNIGQVLRYAVATGKLKFDPTPTLRGALPPARHTNYAAPTDDPESVGQILRMFDALTGYPQIIAAVKLLPLLACRPGELRTMRWIDVDLDAGEWRYTSTKKSKQHIICLSRQAVRILRDLHPLTGHLPGGWVFISGRTPMKPMSDAAINAAMRRLGIDTKTELTGHGWRALLRTFGDERLGIRPDVIELHLTHSLPDPSGLSNAYSRAKFLTERRDMMQQWADYLDVLRKGKGAVSPTVTEELDSAQETVGQTSKSNAGIHGALQ